MALFGLADTLGSALLGDPRAGQYQQMRGLYGQELGDVRNRLTQQATGAESVSAMQLKNALGQNIAAEQAMAASGRGNPALQQRQAQQRVGDLRAGLAGQQAVAGLMERQQANQQLGQLLMQQRQQDLGTMQQQAAQPTSGERLLGLGQGLAGMGLLSDRRAKTDIRAGARDATSLLDSLKAYSYRYRDDAHGKGKQLGVMAQDLERSAAGRQAVIDTPHGKMVDGAKLAGALAAASSQMHERLKKLEAK
jgi:hypothetical protein